MALITRRHFARQMAFAAALCGRPLSAIGELHRLFDPDKQNGASLDQQTIHKLASQIVGQVITPEGHSCAAVAPRMSRVRSILPHRL